MHIETFGQWKIVLLDTANLLKWCFGFCFSGGVGHYWEGEKIKCLLNKRCFGFCLFVFKELNALPGDVRILVS